MSDSSVFAASAARQTSALLDDKDMAINAWRGIAALLVAYFHCRQVTWIGMQQFHRTAHAWDANTVISYLTFPIAWGSAGVPIFFVISGYCIHRAMARRLIADPSARFDSVNFLLRRFARIYPVLIAALLLTFALDSLSETFLPVSRKINPFDLHAFLVNLLSLQGIAGKTFGSNGALWTLSIEVQFYLVYPLLIALRRRIGMRGVLIFVGLVNLASALAFERQHIVVFTSYWFAWTSGAWIAEAKALGVRARSRTGFVAGAIALAGCGAFSLAQYAAFQLWAVAFAVYLFGALDKPMRETLAARGLSSLGEFSFSLYVVHLPIFVLLGSIFFRSALQTDIWATFAFTAVAVGVALAFHFVVERPAMMWSAALKHSLRSA
ncbi:acyltransferase family protein [Caballeronia ptereochthonis]|uniref:Lipopolysaccharide biosynthesis-related membrane protein n=1 Tax=Caballeronia ptereochthonis TaxID=1777144 RepID=A0A158B7C4_9BURK|nr:acyltransferase [Caballeronia ptereochthonis]SAK65646.1 lipopolysaccharide biosynthesis-related membrane protein [Caballeronia ptereochthonis]